MTLVAPEKMRRPWYLAGLLPLYRLLNKYRPEWFKVPSEIKVDVYASAMPLEGNWLYRLVFPPFLNKIRHEIAAEDELRKAAAEGTIIYVMRRRGQLEYNFFQHLFVKNDLPLVAFANDISLCRWMRWPNLKATFVTRLANVDRQGGFPDPISSGWIKSLILSGRNVLLSLYPTELEDEAIILSYSQKLIREAMLAKRETKRPLFFVPLEFIWDRRPQRAEKTIVDILFGEKENPGRIRKMILFWRNYNHRAVARIGKPISLSELTGSNEQTYDNPAVHRVGHELLSALKLERRTIVGPPARPKNWFIEWVLSDDQFQQQLCMLAADVKKPADDLQELAKRYINEIAADINYTYIDLGTLVLKWSLKSLYSGLVYNKEGLKDIKQLYAGSPIIFIPNHKSHFDYLLISYILHKNFMAVPYVAAGINLAFWPLGAIFRRCGAYFIRRSFENNRLYKLCIETYLKVLLEEGYSQEIFIEGQRSRTGKLMPPRYGMIKMLASAISKNKTKDMYFVPVSLTYDQVLEQKGYGKEVEGASKKAEKPFQLIHLFKYLKRQKHRYGKIYLNFGKPISYRSIETKAKPEEISKIVVNDACHEISRHIIVTPQSITALAILSYTEEGTTLVNLRQRASLFLSYLRFKEIGFSQSLFLDPDAAISNAIDSLADAKIISLHNETYEPFYSCDEEDRLQLDYFKNGCAHFFASISVLSILLLKHTNQGVTLKVDQFLDDFSFCQGLLKYEFRFSTDLPVREHILKILKYFASQNAIVLEDDGSFGFNTGAESIIEPFSRILSNFFESIRIALSSIKRTSFEKTNEKDLIRKMLQAGKNMTVLGHIKHREALSKINLANALQLFRDLKILDDSSNEMGTKGRKIFSTTDNKELLHNLQAQLERLA